LRTTGIRKKRKTLDGRKGRKIGEEPKRRQKKVKNRCGGPGGGREDYGVRSPNVNPED